MCDDYIIMYRTTLISVYKVFNSSDFMRCWSYRPDIDKKEETIIKKVVAALTIGKT